MSKQEQGIKGYILCPKHKHNLKRAIPHQTDLAPDGVMCDLL